MDDFLSHSLLKLNCLNSNEYQKKNFKILSFVNNALNALFSRFYFAVKNCDLAI